MRGLLGQCAICAVFLTAAPALAEVPVISAAQAAAALAAEEIVLIDIRSRAEWQETGLAQGAWPVSMHESDFVPRLQAILAQYGPEKTALICATGGRTAHVAGILEQNGITGIIDVSEGMMGNPRGPGWIAHGMKTVPLAAALADYRAVFPEN